MADLHLTRPAPGVSRDGPRKSSQLGCTIYKIVRRTSANDRALTAIAVIEKSRSSQLRVAISSWRGPHKVEIREATVTIPGVYMPTPSGVSLDVDRLHELINALQFAEAEAISKGMLAVRRSKL